MSLRASRRPDLAAALGAAVVAALMLNHCSSGSSPSGAEGDAGGMAEGAAPSSPGSGGGSSSGGASSGSGSGSGGEAEDAAADAPVVCPAAPPFDPEAPGIKEQCTKVVYVAAGDGMRRITSFDGTTWGNDQDSPTADGGDQFTTAAVVANGAIVVSGDRGVFTSADGVHWTEVMDIPHDGGPNPSRFGTHGAGIGFAFGQFIFVGNAGTYTSVDGLHWSGTTGSDTIPGTSLTGSFSGHVGAVASGGGYFVAGNDNYVLRIYDGATWKETQIPDYAGYTTNLAFGHGLFSLLGSYCQCGGPALDGGVQAGTGLRATSKDGSTWTNLATDATPGATALDGLGHMVWNGSEFLVSGSYYGSTGATSPDGVAWTRVKMSTNIDAIAFDEGVYLGTHGGTLFTSKDGLTWTQVYTTPADGGTAGEGFSRATIGRILK